MRLVIDTNVVLSGLLQPAGAPGAILRAWRANRFEWISAAEQFEELADVLRRPYFSRRLHGQARTRRVLELMYHHCSVHTLRYPLQTSCRDPKDDWLIALLEQSGAEALVTGDTDLSAMRTQYPVLTVADFVTRL